MTIDEIFMQRCLQLAAKGCGFVAPNPMVGAVIVHNGNIIGEGYHRRYGGSHAEVNAVESVGNKQLLSQSDIYVSLEPCSHYGKTPPCAELIVKHRFRRVVIAVQDPNPDVSGKGIQLIRRAGIEVKVGVLEEKSRELNRVFFLNQMCKRPYVTIKWAQSTDGFIDYIRREGGGHPVRFSNDISSVMTHNLRTQRDAIMVGTNTALLDNPRLDARLWYGRSPVRVVIDKVGRLSEMSALFRDNGQVVVLTTLVDYPIKKPNIIPVWVDFERVKTSVFLQKLYELNLNSILVEGGAELLTSFIDDNVWDEAFVEVSPVLLGNGIASPTIDLSMSSVMHIQNTLRYHLKNEITQNII